MKIFDFILTVIIIILIFTSETPSFRKRPINPIKRLAVLILALIELIILKLKKKRW